jgi:hypothetical protein
MHSKRGPLFSTPLSVDFSAPRAIVHRVLEPVRALSALKVPQASVLGVWP